MGLAAFNRLRQRGRAFSSDTETPSQAPQSETKAKPQAEPEKPAADDNPKRGRPRKSQE